MSRRRTFLLPKSILYQLPKSCLQNWWILKSNFNFSKHNVSLKTLRLLWGFFTPCIMKDEWIRILQNPYLRLSRHSCSDLLVCGIIPIVTCLLSQMTLWPSLFLPLPVMSCWSWSLNVLCLAGVTTHQI